MKKIYAAANLDTLEVATSTSRRAIKSFAKLSEGRIVFSPRHRIIRDAITSDRKYYQ